MTGAPCSAGASLPVDARTQSPAAEHGAGEGYPLTEIPSMRPEPDRDNFGRYRLPEVSGSGRIRSWTRATTLAHTISDEYHLTQWKRRMVAAGLAKRRDLVDAAARLDEEMAYAVTTEAKKNIKQAFDTLCDDAAKAAGADDGSRLGTVLHSITEWYDAGRLEEVRHLIPEELMDHLDVYIEVLDGLDIERPAEFIERIVVCSAVDSAGTLDRLVRVPGRPKLVIADLKTQKTVDFGFMEMAIQLAEYAHAEALFDDTTGELVPMPEVDQEIALVFHLPVGQARCTVYEVDLEAGWRAALLAHEVRQTRKQSKAMARVYARPPTTESVNNHMLHLINSAAHPAALIGLWRDHVNRGLPWTAELNRAAAARKAELLVNAH